MTQKSLLKSFQYSLREFSGTTQYYYNPLYKNLNYTDGVKYFMENAGQGTYWFLTLVATEIKPILQEDFYFIELSVNEDKTAKIKVQRDKGEPVLYKKNLSYTDCPPSKVPYKFCLDLQSEFSILCLLSEY